MEIAIIFIWSVLVFLAAKSGLIKDTEEAAEFQNFIICDGVLIAAIGHLYAFSYKEYAGANICAYRGFTASLACALKLNDFYHDTVDEGIETSCGNSADEGPPTGRHHTNRGMAKRPRNKNELLKQRKVSLSRKLLQPPRKSSSRSRAQELTMML